MTVAELWLGYDGLNVPYVAISALLVYQPAWDRRIVQSYGTLPGDVQAVVLLDDGRALPSRRALADLQARWRSWQAAQPDEPPVTADDHAR
jgi:hypothetical protein